MTKSLLRVSCVLLVLCALSGCIALAMGEGAADEKYANGRVVDNVNAPIERAYSASLAMLNAKSLSATSKRADSAAAHITSKFADNAEIRIDIEAVTAQVCEIRIRVGSGDRDRSIELLNGIKARL